MASHLNTELLSSMLKAKRGNNGLRTVAEEIGNISAATLSRVEQGNIPDVETFITLCKWLNSSTEDFIIEEYEQDKKDISTQDIVIAHLRADKTLSKESANTLVDVINHFYKLPTP